LPISCWPSRVPRPARSPPPPASAAASCWCRSTTARCACRRRRPRPPRLPPSCSSLPLASSPMPSSGRGRRCRRGPSATWTWCTRWRWRCRRWRRPTSGCGWPTGSPRAGCGAPSPSWRRSRRSSCSGSRWPEPMGGLRTVPARWREVPHLGVPAALGALAVLLLPGYLYVRQYRHVLAEPDGFVYDFSFFYQAGQRFLADPAALYADVQYLYPPPSVVPFLTTVALPQWAAYLAWNAGVVALAVVCFRRVLRLYARPEAEPVARPLTRGLVLIGLGS